MLQVTDAGPNGAAEWVDLEGYKRGKALYEAFYSGSKQAAAPEHLEPEEEGDRGEVAADVAAGRTAQMGGDKIPF